MMGRGRGQELRGSAAEWKDKAALAARPGGTAIGAVMQLQLGWVRLQLVRNQLQLVRRVAIGAVA